MGTGLHETPTEETGVMGPQMTPAAEVMGEVAALEEAVVLEEAVALQTIQTEGTEGFIPECQGEFPKAPQEEVGDRPTILAEVVARLITLEAVEEDHRRLILLDLQEGFPRVGTHTSNNRII